MQIEQEDIKLILDNPYGTEIYVRMGSAEFREFCESMFWTEGSNGSYVFDSGEIAGFYTFNGAHFYSK